MARLWGSTLWVAGAADAFTARKTSQAEVRRMDGGSKEEAKRGRSTRSRLERWVRGEGSAAWHLIWFCQLTHMQVHERLHQEARSWQEGNRQWLPASAAFPRPGWSQRTRGGEWEAWPSAELWGKPPKTAGRWRVLPQGHTPLRDAQGTCGRRAGVRARFSPEGKQHHSLSLENLQACPLCPTPPDKAKSYW